MAWWWWVNVFSTDLPVISGSGSGNGPRLHPVTLLSACSHGALRTELSVLQQPDLGTDNLISFHYFIISSGNPVTVNYIHLQILYFNIIKIKPAISIRALAFRTFKWSFYWSSYNRVLVIIKNYKHRLSIYFFHALNFEINNC